MISNITISNSFGEPADFSTQYLSAERLTGLLREYLARHWDPTSHTQANTWLFQNLELNIGHHPTADHHIEVNIPTRTLTTRKRDPLTGRHTSLLKEITLA